MKLELNQLLANMVEKKASDLHLKVGTPPVVRKNGALAFLNRDIDRLSHQDVQGLLQPILRDHHKDTLLSAKQIDFSYGIKNLGRFRFNIFFQRGTLRAVIRHIPHVIPNFDSLNLPKQIKDIANSSGSGLILVTGGTGNGKTTTIMSMLDHINRLKNKHIITIEDPIEFLIPDRKSLITQRELGTDYTDYKSALKSALRQDPDIIFFGEIRCAESLSTVLTAANTGHLVLSTLHTKNTSETITRLLGLLGQEDYFRMEFASCLRSIICQRLVPTQNEDGFIPALEILINNPRVRDILEDDKKSASELPQVIEESQDGWGMQSFHQHLAELYNEGLISQKMALKFSDSPERLKLVFSGLSHDNSDKDSKASGQEQADATSSDFDGTKNANTLTLKKDSYPYKKAK